MNPLSNNSQTPNISPSSIPDISSPSVQEKHIVHYKKAPTAEEPFDAGTAKHGVTPFEAVMKALEDSHKIDHHNLVKPLKVNGKFEQLDKTFGGDQAVADVHFSGGDAYFKFNLMWVVQAEDKNREVTVIVKQEIFTNVKIPPDTATTDEMNAAKQRAFMLAKSFELLQKIAIANNGTSTFSPDNLKEIRAQATLTFLKTGAQDASGKVVESKYLKLTDKNIQLDFLNTPSKHTDNVAKEFFTKERYMEEGVTVYFRSDQQSAFSHQTAPKSQITSSSPQQPKTPAPLSKPSDKQSVVSSEKERVSEIDVEDDLEIDDVPQRAEIYEDEDGLFDVPQDAELFEDEEGNIFVRDEVAHESIEDQVQTIEDQVQTIEDQVQAMIDEEDAIYQDPEVPEANLDEIKSEKEIVSETRESFQKAETAVKNLREFLTHPDIVAGRASKKDSTIWQGVLEARKASAKWLKLQNKWVETHNKIVNIKKDEEDTGAGLFTSPKENLASEKAGLEHRANAAYRELVAKNPFIKREYELSNEIRKNLAIVKKNTDFRLSNEDDRRIKKIENEALDLAALFKIIITEE